MEKEKEMLVDFLSKSAKSAGMNGHWINVAAGLLLQIAAEPNDLHKYLKFKCIAVSEESYLFHGLVFTKSPAHNAMPKSCDKPALMLWKGSLDINQDSMESASKTFSFVEDSRANLLLVENSVSREYEHYLLLKDPEVTLVSDMKHRLRRFPARLSTCTSFKCEEIIEDVSDLGENDEKPLKNLMFFEGCESLTILLCGSCASELKVMKGILKSGYNILRNKLLSSTSYLVTLPPLTIQPFKVDGRQEELSVREDEISSFIAYTLQQLESNSHEPNHKDHVSIQHQDQFYQLRKKCKFPEAQYIASLSRCDSWDAKGGKSGAVFSKTRDRRLIIKEINKAEYSSFGEFGPQYFKYLTEALDENKKTSFAKIFGIYEITLRGQPKFLMVMENLLFNRKLSKVYDLKGCLRGRLTPDSAEVYLDQNLINNKKTSPLRICPNSNITFELAIENDTEFLSGVNVMDYSLLLGLDDEKEELVCGIIDYLAPYTWKKEVESKVKLILRKSLPTVISPKEYKLRFLKFMQREFLEETNLRERVKRLEQQLTEERAARLEAERRVIEVSDKIKSLEQQLTEEQAARLDAEERVIELQKKCSDEFKMV